MAKLRFVALRAELTIRGFLKISSRVELEPGTTPAEPLDEGSARILSEGHRACPADLPVDERSARFLYAVSPSALGKIGEHEMKEQCSQARPDHRNVCEKIEGDRPTEMGEGGSQRDPVVFQASPRRESAPAYAECTTGTPPAGRRVPSSVSPWVGFSRWSSTLRPLLHPPGL